MRNKLIRSLLTLCIGVAATGTASAQLGLPKEYIEPPGWSLGVNIGLSDLWGDVGTKSVIDHYGNDKYWESPAFMGGLYARYSFHPALALRLGVNYGTVKATDEWNKSKAESASNIGEDSYQRYLRNQSVRSIMWEPYLMAEFTPRRLNLDSRGASRRFQPYLLAGVGYFHFKPQAKYIDRNMNDRGYVNLYDLNVEATGLPEELYKESAPEYALWQLEVPAGIGVRWDIGRRLALGVEYIYRITFTDYLDNVSGKYVDPSLYSAYLSPQKAALAAEMQDRSWQIDPSVTHAAGEMRGNASNKDAYSTFGVTLIFKVPSKKTPWWY